MTASRPTAACFGEALVVLVPDEAGRLHRGDALRPSLAGAEVNVAVGLAAAGVATSVVSRVGDDAFGRFIADEFLRLGIDARGIEVDVDAPTGLYLKERDLGASRMHYHRAGSAGSRLSPATLRLPGASAVLEGAGLVHTTGITPALGDGPLAAQRALFAERRPERLISFDVNWRPALWRGRERAASEILAEFVSGADLAVVGAAEAAELWGTGDPAELRARFPEPRRLIVTNDGNDAVGFDGDERVEVPSLHTEVVEPIGAGDAFAAGVIAGVLAELSLAGCIARGHRWASRALTSTGDHVGGPARAEVA